ncbi:hypothetical protein SASPL_145963 [Salvia splendens]|uniref:F-box associated beta-propeller type 1 domain-containing protein n=1 Tax=Salvia splendens TaxID=180675 RepID=A0A8X8WIE3_SALSN|nr:hypothetical protein SASPL_145963 [Salvia splendens]
MGLGFNEDYKIVQLLECWRLQHHRYLHASLYSARTNSWRELDIDLDLAIQKPIKSVCKNGSFAHWEGQTRILGKKIILSFDMKNEVFRTITISGDQVLGPSSKFFAILAKGEYSFVILVLSCWRLKVYESSGEGSKLIWNNVNNVILYSLWGFNIWKSDDIPIQRNDDCVVLKGRKSSEVILYD